MRLPLALLIAAGLFAAAPAFAQAPAPSGSPPPAPMHHGRGGSPDGMRDGMKARMEAHRAREAADLTTILRLTPDQQGALAAWLDASRPNWGGHARGGGMGQDKDMAAAPETTAQRLDQEQARMTEHASHAKARLDATRRFYAALSPEQQQVFDALQRMRHGERHGRGHGGRGHDGHGMGGPGGMGPSPMADPPRG